MTGTNQSIPKRLVSVFMAICLAFTLCPLPRDAAWAATGPLKNYKAYLINPKTSEIMYFGTMDDAWSNTLHLDEFTIGLLDDLHLYREWGMSLGKHVTVELNGHKLFKENNKNHSEDGAIISTLNADVTIYGGRSNWSFAGSINDGGKAKVTLASDKADRISGSYYDENGFAQTSGTKSSNAIWNMAYYDLDANKVNLSKNEYTVNGGLITGGWKTYGGGIEMTGKDSVALYDVTMAGNIGDNSGGAIDMYGDYEELSLTDSRITFNWARCDNGGGINLRGNYCRLNMVRSHVDYNIADDLGGGIAVRGDKCTITGDAKALDPSDPDYPANWASGTFTDHPYAKLSAKQNPFWNKVDNDSNRHVGTEGHTSTVAYNILPNADIYGGGSGIFAGWNNKTDYGRGQNTSMSGVNVMKNVALGGSFSGRGAVHFDREGNSLSNSNIWKNYSRSEGGGLFVDNDSCGVSDITVTDNYSDTKGWSGGGVYVLGSGDLAISGKCIIKNNSSYKKPKDDLLLAYNNLMNAKLYPSLSSESEVWVAATSSFKNITDVKGVYDDRVFWCDEDDRHVEFKDNILQFVVDSESDIKTYKTGNAAYRAKKYPAISEDSFYPDPSAITEGSRTTKINTYTSGYGRTYDLYQGVVEFPAFTDTSKDLSSTFFYSDGYFDRDPRSYDEHLATASMHLATASFYSNDGNKGGTLYQSDGCEQDGTFYPVKSNNIRQFLSDIGVAEDDIYLNDFNIEKPGPDTIGVAIGSKKIKLDGKDKTLVVVGVRGSGYEQEWVSNMTMGSKGEAQGFASAADQTFSELNKYLKAKGIDGSSENTIFWVAGYSRAGATSNLTGARIVDKYDENNTHTFVYTFAAPQGGSKDVRDNSGEKYYCIHNIVNAGDLVPQVGPSSMGFHRYGVDHYLPGSNAGSRTKSQGKYVGYSTGIAGDEYYSTWCDNSAYTAGNFNYDNQKGKMLSQLKYIADYDIIYSDYFKSATMSYIHSTAFSGFGAQLIVESGNKWSSPAEFNRYFLDDLLSKALNFKGTNEYRQPYSMSTDLGIPFERAAADAAGVVFALDGKQMEKFMELAGTLKARIDMSGLYLDFLRGKKSAAAQSKEIWDALAKPTEEGRSKGYTYLQDILTPEQMSTLEKSAPTLLTVLLDYMKKDYKETKNDVIGTLGYNVSRIMMNHYPEVNLAWVRSYDSYYDGQTGKVKMADSAKVSRVSPVYAINESGGTTLSLRLTGDNPKVKLAVDGDVNRGANIYYRFTEGDGVDYKWHPYCGPFAIPTDENRGNLEYKIEAYAIHDGIRNSTTTITVTVDFGNTFTYQVPNSISSWFSPDMATFRINEGGTYNFEAPTRKTEAFKKWTWTTDQAAGEAGLSGLDMKSRTNRFKVEKAGRYGVKAEYFEKSNDVSLTLGEATEFELPTTAHIVSSKNLSGTVSAKENVTVPIAWVSGGGGKYLANIALPEDADNELSYIGQPSGFIFKSYDSKLKASVAANAANSDALNAVSVVPQGESDHGLAAAQLSSSSNAVTLEPIGEAAGFVDGNGNATVRQWFSVSGYVGPSERTTVALSAWDMNTDTATAFDTGEGTVSYLLKKGTEATIPIPAVAGEVFAGIKSAEGIELENVKVADGALTFTVPDEEFAMTLNYKPVVSEVVVELGSKLEAGKWMPTYAGAVATIDNSWVITDGITSAWSPDNPSTAAYGTSYTLELTIDKSNLVGGKLNDEGASWSQVISDIGSDKITRVKMAGVFEFSDDVAFEVQDADGNVMDTLSSVTVGEDGNIVVKLAFAPTDQAAVVEVPEQDSVNIDYTAAPTASALPSTIDVILQDGTMAPVDATWSLESYTADPGGYKVGAYATLKSNTYDLGLLGDDFRVFNYLVVMPAAAADPPTANLIVNGMNTEAGAEKRVFVLDDKGNPVLDAEGVPVYKDEMVVLGEGGDYSAKVALSAANGATIRYTIATDGTEPADPTASSAAYSTPVEIGWGDAVNPDSSHKSAIVKAYAFEDGKQVSAVQTFEYHLEAIPAFKTQSLVLTGQIGVNFYVSLPTIENVDYSKSYMEFTVKGRTTRVDYDANKVNASGNAGFTCYVNAIEMAEPITAVFNYGDGKTVTKTYSVKQYIQAFEDNAADYDAQTVALVRAVADYGHYAQLLLSKTNKWEIGKDYGEMDEFYTTSFDIDALKNVTSPFAVSRKISGKDIADITYSLSFYADTTINVYFKPSEGYSGSFTVQVDGKETSAEKRPDGRYVVRIPGIAAHQMNATHTVTATTDSGSATLSVSALSYAQGRLALFTDKDSNDMGAAIYKYYEAAQAYKASH